MIWPSNSRRRDPLIAYTRSPFATTPRGEGTGSSRTLVDGGFVDRCENILAFGNPGSGKTHLLCAIGHELVAAGRSVYFASTSLLVEQLLGARRDLRLDR